MPRLPTVLSAPTTVQTSGRIRAFTGTVQLNAALPLEQTLNRAQNQVQQNTARATSQARAAILAGANLVTGLSFTSGATTTINTGLPSPLQGFFISNPRLSTAGVPLLVNVSPLTQAVGTLLVQSAGTFVCDVVVF